MKIKQNTCFKQKGAISTPSCQPLKLVDQFSYFGCNFSSTECDVSIQLVKVWNAVESSSIKWKSDLFEKIKQDIFQAAVVLVLLYGHTTLTITKHMEKNQDGNNTRMLRTILNKSLKQHSTNQQLYGDLPHIQIKRTSHAGHCWKSEDKRCYLMHGHANIGRPAKT